MACNFIKETATKVFFCEYCGCEYCGFVKNTYFEKQLRTASSDNSPQPPLNRPRARLFLDEY